MTKCEIAEADVLQQSQRVMNGGVRGEELHCLIDAHRQYFANATPAVEYRQRIGREARAAACLAGDFNVGQEAHLDPANTLSLADLAATPAHVEGKSARAITADARLA